MSQTHPRRLFLGIAVGYPDGLDPLPGVHAALDAMTALARAHGDDCLCVDDRTVDADGARTLVSSDSIRNAFEPYLIQHRSQIDRVTVYFAGHGYLVSGEPVWVLSRGQTLSHHRIAVHAFRAALETYGPRQISLISDACKTTTHFETRAEAGLRESGSEPNPDLELDTIFATQNGRAAYAKDMGDTLLFSTVFRRFLDAEFPEAVDEVNDGKVTSRTIKLRFRPVFERELASMKVFKSQKPSIHAGFQHPLNDYATPPQPSAPETAQPPEDADLAPKHGVRINRDFIIHDMQDRFLDRPSSPYERAPSRKRKVKKRPAKAEPEVRPSKARSGLDRTFPQRLGDAARTRAGQAAGDAWDTLDFLGENWDVAVVSDRALEPPRFTIRPLFEQRQDVAWRTDQSMHAHDNQSVRLATFNTFAQIPLLELGIGDGPDALTLWLPRYDSLRLQITLGKQPGAPLSQAPQSPWTISDLSWRSWFSDRFDDVKPWRILTAFLANKLQTDDVGRLADRLRIGKHVDPMRGVICAYLYDRIGALSSITDTAAFYPRYGQAIPFDIALLARAPLHWRRESGWMTTLPQHEDTLLPIGGLAPWLSAGWARLSASADPRLNALSSLQAHLSDQPVAALTGELARRRARALILELQQG